MYAEYRAVLRPLPHHCLRLKIVQSETLNNLSDSTLYISLYNSPHKAVPVSIYFQTPTTNNPRSPELTNQRPANPPVSLDDVTCSAASYQPRNGKSAIQLSLFLSLSFPSAYPLSSSNIFLSSLRPDIQ